MLRKKPFHSFFFFFKYWGLNSGYSTTKLHPRFFIPFNFETESCYVAQGWPGAGYPCLSLQGSQGDMNVCHHVRLIHSFFNSTNLFEHVGGSPPGLENAVASMS